MTDRQNDKMNMHIATLDYCNASKNVWSGIPVFGRYVDELQACVKEVKKIMQSAVKGATVQKGSAEDVPVQECLAMGGALYAFGFDTGNPVLMETGRVNKYEIYQQHGHLTLAREKNIGDVAFANMEKGSEYGIGETEYMALMDAIGAYEALIVSPREAINERKRCTGGLAQALAATDSVLHDKMDKIAARFKHTNPNLYNGYKDVRAVKSGQSIWQTDGTIEN